MRELLALTFFTEKNLDPEPGKGEKDWKKLEKSSEDENEYGNLENLKLLQNVVLRQLYSCEINFKSVMSYPAIPSAPTTNSPKTFLMRRSLSTPVGTS